MRKNLKICYCALVIWYFLQSLRQLGLRPLKWSPSLKEVFVGNKLYVGNLSYNTSDQTLADLFAQVGQVESAKVIIDRETGRSKGFGFVEMSSEGEALDAIEKFNGVEQDGRALKVNEAKPMAPRENRGGGGYGDRSQNSGGYSDRY